MSDTPGLPENLAKDCTRVGYAPLNSWFNENNISLVKSDNFFDSLAKTIVDGGLTRDQLNHAIAELDENSDKKIYLMGITNFIDLEPNKASILKGLHQRKGIVASDKQWVNGDVKSINPTFINLYWEGSTIKIKYSEIQYNVEFDPDSEKTIKIEKRVNIIFLIDTSDGFVQIRFDSPGNKHIHKNDVGKLTEAAYEGFYKQLLFDLFLDSQFKDLNLNRVANQIANNEKAAFRITKGTTTISNNAKQTFATASTQSDIRDIPEYEAAAAGGTDYWLPEDLVGYWVAAESNNELKKDLYMRISRRNSQVRVQRGCLEKELNYGIRKIREIQGAV